MMLNIDSNNYSIHLGGHMIAWKTFSIKGWSNRFHEMSTNNGDRDFELSFALQAGL